VGEEGRGQTFLAGRAYVLIQKYCSLQTGLHIIVIYTRL
jgi:hypothetical protein